MAVNLFDLVDPLRREINPPGSDLFPDATDDTFLGSLTDAFWEVRLYGFLDGFEENVAARGGPATYGEGVVTPIGVTDGYDLPGGYVNGKDLRRELQQLVVAWAGWKIALTRMTSLNTVFRAQAGSVQFETQSAASVLKGVLDQLRERMQFLIKVLSSYGEAGSVVVFDAVIERTYAEAFAETWWLR